MAEIRLAHATDFAGWRDGARTLLAAGTAPEAAGWRVGEAQPGLFDTPVPPTGAAGAVGPTVPLRFLLLARRAALHTDPGRWALLYRLLWRLHNGERQLLERASDPDIVRLSLMVRAVERAAHRMQAFLRFKEVWTRAGPRYLAWFEPEHHVLELCAGFFARRLATLSWTIVTPEHSVAWDGATLRYGPGGHRADVPAEDAQDEAWRTYYASVFNPARVNRKLMHQHMPRRYWQDLPETRAISGLLATAAADSAAMLAAAPAEPARKGRVVLLPHPRHRAAASTPARPARPTTLAAAREEAAGCRACPLWEPATRTVFGEGPATARVMLVGEQPGDWEDLEGRPFVGPAGQLLDKALAEAGLARSALYLTNAVKHFKFKALGKRRLHQRPTVDEARTCAAAWLGLERDLLRPRLIVALGATAASTLLGREVRLLAERGRLLPLGADGQLLLTIHPAYILRLPDARRQAEEYARLVAELRLATPYLSEPGAEAAA